MKTKKLLSEEVPPLRPSLQRPLDRYWFDPRTKFVHGPFFTDEMRLAHIRKTLTPKFERGKAPPPIPSHCYLLGYHNDCRPPPCLRLNYPALDASLGIPAAIPKEVASYLWDNG